MGSCVSKPNRIKALPRRYRRPGKRRGRISTSIPDVPRRRLSDAGVRDFAVSEFVHLDFEKGSTISGRRSVSKIHLTQLQWNHSQIDANGKVPNFQQENTIFLFTFLNTKLTFMCRVRPRRSMV